MNTSPFGCLLLYPHAIPEVDELEVAQALAVTKPVLLWSGAETFSEVLEADVGATSAI